MPETKTENLIFTLLTSGIMIYFMGVYNTALHSGALTYSTFLIAARSFPLEWLIGFLLAFFLVGKAAKMLAFRIVTEHDRAIVIVLCIQTFTVCLMVLLMSFVGCVEQTGITPNLPVIWVQTVCFNFIMALPLQIFVVGPFCRAVFRKLFRRGEKA